MPHYPLLRTVTLHQHDADGHRYASTATHLQIGLVVGTRRNEFVPPYGLERHYRPGSVDGVHVESVNVVGTPLGLGDRIVPLHDPLWTVAREWARRHTAELLDEVREEDDAALAEEQARDAALLASVGLHPDGRAMRADAVLAEVARDYGREAA